MKPAVFLDRDGVLIEEKNYLHQIDDVAFIPRTGRALQRLQNAGFTLFIVTNQSGVGRGYYPMSDVDRVHGHLESFYQASGVQFARIYVAPEAPDQPSRGRKPSPQFLFDARDEFGLDLALSYLVGDKLIDLECGWNANIKRCLLVRTGYGAKVEKQQPDALKRAIVVNDLDDAATWILNDPR
jgi:D-glycero-D-manno-heptose 1,7-bisphosphate phosphatase